MSVTAEMPKYICHKVVSALKLIGVEQHFEKGVWLIPEDKRFEPIVVTDEWCREKKVLLFNVHDRGYYVIYEDGYTSWSPTEAFEKGYSLWEDPARAPIIETPVATPVERYTYYVPPCGCKGFFHDSSCGDQNVIDPLGAISNPENRERLRSMLAGRLSPSSLWVGALRSLYEEARRYDKGDVSLREAIDLAKNLLDNGIALEGSPLEQALIEISKAKDGEGRFVRLLPNTDYSSTSLRKTINDFLRIDFDRLEFFGRDSAEKTRGMAAWYRNLSLLANATALAIACEQSWPSRKLQE